MCTKLPTVCCKCSRSCALTTLLLRGRAARRRSSSASGPRGPLAARRASSSPRRPGCRLARPEGRGPAAPRGPPARSGDPRPAAPSPSRRAPGEAERSGAAAAQRPPPALSRPGSAQGDATRRRLREGLFVINVSGNNFPRAGPSYFCLGTRAFPPDGVQPLRLSHLGRSRGSPCCCAKT